MNIYASATSDKILNAYPLINFPWTREDENIMKQLMIKPDSELINYMITN